MSWLLFLQIEIILLTVGMIISFSISFFQTSKDNSFAKRIGAIGNASKELGKIMAENKRNDESKIVAELAEILRKKKEEKHEN